MKIARILFLLVLSSLLDGCSSDEISATGRALSGAYDSYYNRPAYYPIQPQPYYP